MTTPPPSDPFASAGAGSDPEPANDPYSAPPAWGHAAPGQYPPAGQTGGPAAEPAYAPSGQPGYPPSGQPGYAPSGQPPYGSVYGAGPGVPSGPVARTRAPIVRSEVIAALVVAGVLIVLGVVLGFAWAAWAHGSSQAGSKVFSTSIGNIPDESEGFVAGDGRFAVLTMAVGLVAGIAVWLRRASRGPVMPLALGFGGLVGAALTAWVGHLASSGRTSAPENQIFVAKLSLHMHGLVVLEAGVALLVYLVCTLVIGSDALGRRDDPQETPSQSPPWQPTLTAGPS